ncbi:MAG: ferric reductase [Roseobacter sp.]
MKSKASRMWRALFIWSAVVLAIVVPIGAALQSPLLAWREPIYIIAGLAGVIAMALILLQPLLMGGYLPGMERPTGRRAHLWVGGLLIFAVIIHVMGLWITSPPDVMDALMFVSPTSFSIWGVIAMWAVLLAGFVAAMRRRLPLKPRVWRQVHAGFAIIVVIGSVVHAMLIDGTMETGSKANLCIFVLLATAKVVADLRIWKRKPRPTTQA